MPRNTNTSESPDERRRIIDAAWRVLERSAFQGLKVGSVVRAVPTSTRTFYRWFNDKDDLAIELVREEYLLAALRLDVVMREAPPDEAIRRWIEGYVLSAVEPSLAARARLFSSLRSASPSSSARIADALNEFLTPLRRTIEQGCHEGLFTTDDPQGDAISVHHLCASAMLDVLGADDAHAGAAAAQATDRVVAFVRRALGTTNGR